MHTLHHLIFVFKVFGVLQPYTLNLSNSSCDTSTAVIDIERLRGINLRLTLEFWSSIANCLFYKCNRFPATNFGTLQGLIITSTDSVAT